MSNEDKWYISGPLAIGTPEPAGQLTLEGIVQPGQGRLTFFSKSADVEYDGGNDELFVFRNTAPNGKTAFMGGNVGIGTGNPSAGLEIDKGETNDVALLLNSSGPGWGSGMQLRNTAQGGKSYGIYSGFGRLHFADLDAGVDRLVVDGSGNVGIGTTHPSAGLEIDKGSTNDVALALNSSGPGWGSGLQLKNTAPGGKSYGIYSGSSKLHFADLDAGVDRLLIDGSGNVGIGTSTPTGKLDVQGDIRAGNSDIYFTKTDHRHSGIGNTTGHAAIENASDFDALMILGRAGAGTGAPRKVQLWDYLEVKGNLNVTGTISLSGELPFHYATFIAKFGERSIDTGWEVSKYVVTVVGFDFSRPGIQAYIDRSAPTSQIKYNSQSAGSDGVIYVLRIRKELVSGL